MKLIIANSSNDGYNMFFDGTGEFITNISPNDGDWRSEYMDPIANHFGIEVAHMAIRDLVNEDKFESLWEEDQDKAKEMITKALKAKLQKGKPAKRR